MLRKNTDGIDRKLVCVFFIKDHILGLQNELPYFSEKNNGFS